MLSKISYGLLSNISCWRKKPNNRRIWNPLHNAVLCIKVLLTSGLQLTLVDTKQKIKTYHDCIAYSFLFEGCFCFPIFLWFPKHIKLDQNFVTKKPKKKKFSEFLRFCNLFHEPLGEWNNSKTWETRKIFANIARGNVR